ncbi:glutaminase A [Leptolyngbya sp. 'hensonii']|uniref:glutaminase A n=1 Tax=Leptolyngbya sp. 'hensonii' TaxID=1922337 RepID=UPI00094FA9C3|nr:glutaminase A [Leptolyngbya sp. 'hensonii']OLP18545.1 glutaminase A [Leptolyngbya sp. 'hensonii']
MSLLVLTQSQLEALTDRARILIQEGRQPDYIPLLGQINPKTVAVRVWELGGLCISAGDKPPTFSLMSVIKPFLLLFLLEHLGHDVVFKQVGVEPSDQPFNSLEQLKLDRGRPRNPMLNSGAIALSALLPGANAPEACEVLRHWLNQVAQCQLGLDQQMLASVRSTGGRRNREITAMLTQSGYLVDGDLALDIYNHICCLSGTITDLALLGLLLATPQSRDAINRVSALGTHRRMVNALMLTCGLYEASGQYAVRIGLPAKSGVSGALLAVVPGQGTIACYGPALDDHGNSIAGLFLVEELAQLLDLSVFN